MMKATGIRWVETSPHVYSAGIGELSMCVRRPRGWKKRNATRIWHIEVFGNHHAVGVEHDGPLAAQAAAEEAAWRMLASVNRMRASTPDEPATRSGEEERADVVAWLTMVSRDECAGVDDEGEETLRDAAEHITEGAHIGAATRTKP